MCRQCGRDARAEKLKEADLGVGGLECVPLNSSSIFIEDKNASHFYSERPEGSC